MGEHYCDIVPDASGWVVLTDGTQSPAYPSYGLAVEAARRQSDRLADARKSFVLRHQDLKGHMREISEKPVPPSGTSGNVTPQ
ncbi:hypothetical protein FE840_007115 [Peteryoungia desertarenae]|uniref:DUF2188 domain-containing protein n=1 Tax=Peteryoungia desertarenae TaxID=1813451 RepID=A0ABX6QL77_9HYPH|nr:hypothetical protein [Peteryoungia desertarenae]QLF69326.1 hypothetical protein FE840_007115 [Peteryoungia desertarenae]